MLKSSWWIFFAAYIETDDKIWKLTAYVLSGTYFRLIWGYALFVASPFSFERNNLQKFIVGLANWPFQYGAGMRNYSPHFMLLQ